MEVENHRNQALCSHDLIWHGGAGSSGQGSATAQDGKPENLARLLSRNGRIALLFLLATHCAYHALIFCGGGTGISPPFNAGT